MKRIAVATLNGKVSGHFGHCKLFTFYNIDGTSISTKIAIESPAQGHGALPLFLKEQGAEIVIVGGMGPGAKNGLQANGITPIIGATGDIDDVIETYIKGKLTSTDSLCDCRGHDHHHSHGHHHGGTYGKNKCGERKH